MRRETVPLTRSPTLKRSRGDGPRIFLQRFQAEADLLCVRVDFEDLDFEFVARLSATSLAFAIRVCEISPTCSNPSTPPISTKAPKSITLRTRPRTKAPSRKIGKRLLTPLRFLLFENDAPIDYDIFFLGVEFGDPALNFLPHQLGHVIRFANTTARGRHKGTDANVNPKAAFHLLRDGSDNASASRQRQFANRSSHEAAPLLAWRVRSSPLRCGAHSDGHVRTHLRLAFFRFTPAAHSQGTFNLSPDVDEK